MKFCCYFVHFPSDVDSTLKDLRAVPLNNYESPDNRCSEECTSLTDVTKFVCHIFYISRPIWVKLIKINVHKNLPSHCDFREHRQSIRHVLLRGTNELTSMFYIFIVRSG